MNEIEKVGLVGTGVIGSGWAARVLARGRQVIAWDPDPACEEKLRNAVDNAWPSLVDLGLFANASRKNLCVVDSFAEVVERADFIQESAPERLEIKQEILQEIDDLARPDVVIASSTSGLLPTALQVHCRHPERVVVGHPFNPVYLLPLVEVLGGEQTQAEYLDVATDFYADLGMHPLRVRTEVPGFLSDRLQEALWREALHLVNEGIATPEELDTAIAYGPGLRWAFWGTCLHFHLAGGQGGMRHTLTHFDPSLFPWTKLDPPPIGEELIEAMATGCEEQAAGRSLSELESTRDRALVAILRALKSQGIGAGGTLSLRDRRIAEGE